MSWEGTSPVALLFDVCSGMAVRCSTSFAGKQRELRQAGLATVVWEMGREGGRRIRSSRLAGSGHMGEEGWGPWSLFTLGASKLWTQYSPAVVCSGHRPHSNLPPRGTGHQVHRVPGLNSGARPPRALCRAGFLAAPARRCAGTSLTAQSLRTLRSAQTGE